MRKTHAGRRLATDRVSPEDLICYLSALIVANIGYVQPRDVCRSVGCRNVAHSLPHEDSLANTDKLRVARRPKVPLWRQALPGDRIGDEVVLG